MQKRLLLTFAIFMVAIGQFTTLAKIPLVTVANKHTVVLADSSTVLFNDSVIQPNYMFIPIIFEHQKTIDPQTPKRVANNKKGNELKLENQWLIDALKKTQFEMYHINEVIYRSPELVKYNVQMLPEPPKQYIIKVDPSKATLSLEEFEIKVPDNMPSAPKIKPKKWIHGYASSIQFSQAYLSSNWYQGGNSNLNLLGDFKYNVKLNPNAYPKFLFETSLQYKISLNSAPQDSVRSYSISEDLFQLNTKFGVKAAKNWFYTTTLQFKTQFFQNFKPNTYDLKAAFLTPGELNVGIGMTYNTKSKDNRAVLDVSIAPGSYNMKICLAKDRIKPESLGMEAGKTIQNQIGSSVEGKLFWKIHTNITLSSRLFVFTDYSYIQGDLENTVNFSINKYLSTQFYLHLRYDSSSAIVSQEWKHWQLKEILSFGFSYKI
ncbi:MAG: DUF3078 domain-containing protein [Muribaculaceae bacterium]